MNYKLVSSKQIIAKVFRDLKPDTGSFVTDSLEWIGEALEFIGVHSGLEKKFEEVEMINHRGDLPCDLHLISGVEYLGERLNYGSDFRAHALPDGGITNPYALSIVTTAYETDPQDPNTFKEVNASTYGSDYYTLDAGVIRTSFDAGTIIIYYMGIPMDCDFFPKVPDNATTKEAIVWYILRQMIMGGYKHPIFSFDYCDAKWESYCGKAQNDLMFPSPDKAEQFRKMWVNMIPNINAYNSFDSDHR